MPGAMCPYAVHLVDMEEYLIDVHLLQCYVVIMPDDERGGIDGCDGYISCSCLEFSLLVRDEADEAYSVRSLQPNLTSFKHD